MSLHSDEVVYLVMLEVDVTDSLDWPERIRHAVRRIWTMGYEAILDEDHPNSVDLLVKVRGEERARTVAATLQADDELKFAAGGAVRLIGIAQMADGGR